MSSFIVWRVVVQVHEGVLFKRAVKPYLMITYSLPYFRIFWSLRLYGLRLLAIAEQSGTVGYGQRFYPDGPL